MSEVMDALMAMMEGEVKIFFTSADSKVGRVFSF